MKVLLATNGFKECMSSSQVADIIENALYSTNKRLKIEKCPAIDGGEGFCKDFVTFSNGRLYNVGVRGPLDERIESHFGICELKGRKTGIIESASVIGLSNVPKEKRNPLYTTTYGVGELILSCLEHEPEVILIGHGDSSTNDAGIGLAQALGVKFYDDEGKEIGFGGKELRRIKRLYFPILDRRTKRTNFIGICNLKSILYGEEGTTKIYAPRKGASKQDVDILEKGIENYTKLVEESFQGDIRYLPGGGASGGMGSALWLYLNAELRDNFYILEEMGIREMVDEYDVVFISEGRMDSTTFRGKINQKLVDLAKKHNKKVVAVVGDIEGSEVKYKKKGIDTFLNINPQPLILEDAIKHAQERLYNAVKAYALEEL